MTQVQNHEVEAELDESNEYALLALQNGERLPVQVLKNGAGLFYLGTYTERGPFTRESQEYWRTEKKAQKALETGDWTQRWHL